MAFLPSLGPSEVSDESPRLSSHSRGGCDVKNLKSVGLRALLCVKRRAFTAIRSLYLSGIEDCWILEFWIRVCLSFHLQAEAEAASIQAANRAYCQQYQVGKPEILYIQHKMQPKYT